MIDMTNRAYVHMRLCPRKFLLSHLLNSSCRFSGAHDRNRTGEPLPYQGSALPTELRGRFVKIYLYDIVPH